MNSQKKSQDKLNFISEIIHKLSYKDIFSIISNVGTQGILIHKNGTPIYVNKSFLDIIGYEYEEIEGKNIIDLLTVDKTNDYLFDINKCKNINKQKKFIKKRGGGIIEVSCESKEIVNKKEKLQVFLLNNISQLEEAEFKQLEAEAKYRILAENTNDVIWILDVKTFVFKYISNSIKKLAGFEVESLVNKRISNDFFKMPSTTIEKLLNKRLSIYLHEKKEKTYVDEIELRCENGVYKWVELITFFKRNLETSRIEVIGTIRDIDDRKKAEQKAQYQQMHRELLLKNAPLAIIEWDLNYTILAWNSAAKNIFKYSALEAIGKNFFDLIVHNSQIVEIKSVVNNLIYNAKSNNHKNINRTKEGNEIICEWFNNVIYDSDGNPQSIVSIAKDITEVEKARKAHEIAKNKYELLINSLQEGVVMINFEEQIVYANESFQKMLGYEKKELHKKNLFEIVPESEHSRILDETEKRKLGKNSKYVIQLIAKTGKIKNVSFSVVPWQNELNEIIGSIVMAMDVSNQIKSNRELNRRYLFEKKIFEITSRFIDTSNFAKKVNQSIEDIGKICEADEAFIVKFDYPQKRSKLSFFWSEINTIKQNVLNDYPFNNLDWAINQLTSREHFFIKTAEDIPAKAEPFKTDLINNGVTNFMAFPIFLGLTPYGFLAIKNIGSIRQLNSNEFILIRNMGEIISNYYQRKLNEDQIKKLNVQLTQKHKEIEQVLYITSHDIRSPLVNIIGFTQELSKTVDELNEYLGKEVLTEEDKENMNYLIHEDIPEVLRFINAGGVKIDKLLNSLLKLSRLGRFDVELTEVKTNAIIDDIIKSMEFQIQDSKIEMLVDEMPTIITDRNLFTQVITNLVDNAIKYYDPTKKSFIKLTYEDGIDEITFIIEDNGIGISKDKQEKVFEIFSRLNPEATQGEGIGLTIIKKAVEKLNGRIELESAEGEGSKFIIVLSKNSN